MAAIQFTKFMSKSCQDSAVACSQPTSYSAKTRKNNIIGTLGSANDRLKLGWFQVDAVRLIAEGKAPRIIQPQEGATYECIQKKDNSKVKCKMIHLSPFPNTAGSDQMSTYFKAVHSFRLNATEDIMMTDCLVCRSTGTSRLKLYTTGSEATTKCPVPGPRSMDR